MSEPDVQLVPADPQILAETELMFPENNEIGEGLCSCVCINDEQCCGCLLQ
ncbi:MAG: hypothetical protein HYX75_14125 [Acidobacteria bacterium]|nr:hypothetical protein [Acidobacteriota bacterium]